MTTTDRTTTVYGSSDDLVELDGAIRDEISCYDAEVRLTFDTGTRLRIEYDADGIWRITDATKTGPAPTIVRCEDRDGFTDRDGPIYSDLATVVGAASFKAKVRG